MAKEYKCDCGYTVVVESDMKLKTPVCPQCKKKMEQAIEKYKIAKNSKINL